MANLFYRNPRLTLLTICLILVSGMSSFYVLPRMEDPLLTERFAMINTRLPGADAERVESLISEKIEEEFQEIDEIKELRSVSRSGISTITVELRDDIYEVDTVWSRIRDKLGDAAILLPPDASDPEFERQDVKAYAIIAALKWNRSGSTDPNYAILGRLAEQLDDNLRGVAGTEEVDTFGDPDEEILVEIKPEQLTSMGLTAGDIARQLTASDSKITAGQLRAKNDLLIEVDGELDSLSRIAQTPIHFGSNDRFVVLGDIADIRKTITEPPSSLAIIEGQPAVVLGVMVRPSFRVDHWSTKIKEQLDQFASSLPRGIELVKVFEQDEYVETRLTGLLRNLIVGGLAVAVVILLMMGWRSAFIVSSALPLSALMVLAGMRFLGIPIHQMSVTGLIIALGLLIDNAIVIVDEVTEKLRRGLPAADAVSSSVRHLAVPLLGSTLTTAFAFAPIALMPGPAGEFVGSIAISVILAIASSFFLAMTIVPALSAWALHKTTASDQDPTQMKSRWNLFQNGFSNARLTSAYRKSLDFIFHKPAIGLIIGLILPLFGFFQSRLLPEQFFPAADRDQFQIELELPPQSSMKSTLAQTRQIRNQLLDHEQVKSVSWVVGESAPSFYYNIVPRRRDTSNYAQAMVQLNSAEHAEELIHQVQEELDHAFRGSRILVRQLEQGPPFDAPLEIRLFGPDLDVLRSSGNQLRKLLSDVPTVTHTRSDLADGTPKISLEIDEESARLAGLDHRQIAQQVSDTLEGALGGTVLEETEELPVRVRMSNSNRGELISITSLDLLSTDANENDSRIPLTALGEVALIPESATIPRFNGQRMNEVQAYLKAGTLPAEALADFEQRLAMSDFQLPNGYSFEYGGETSKRDDAIGNLMANVGVLLVLMAATLVLSFSSFRMAGIIGVVAILSSGLSFAALWALGYPFGFMAIVGTMGLIGVAINDAIVVLAAIREDEAARTGDPAAVRDVVVRSTRHVIATSLTTIAGFMPLLLGGGGFWPPLAVCIAGGVGGATILALYFAPSGYVVLMCRRKTTSASLLPTCIESHTPGTRINQSA